jgi:hypothetical protein
MTTAGSIAHERCWHHEHRQAACRCVGCRRNFCRECVTEHGERYFCAECLGRTGTAASRSARLRAISGSLGRIATAAAFLALLFSAWGAVLERLNR